MALSLALLRCVNVLFRLMAGTQTLLLRDLPLSKSFVSTENFKEGQGIHVVLGFSFPVVT